jgi:hypothetical protein
MSAMRIQSPESLVLPAECLRALIMNLPEMMQQALRRRYHDPSPGMLSGLGTRSPKAQGQGTHRARRLRLRHIRGALEAGATPDEISAVLQLAAALSVHTCTLGIPGWEDVMNGKLVDPT